ncbi:MAG: hypothetical protein HN870_06740 [Gammaproteobacteria bacterium]|jgi:hypothetical protein|nr:hypothetical protein [Thiotrichales bacterium]MBT7230336.1 hypothetical protein [Gammaproteobacteria bacterium]
MSENNSISEAASLQKISLLPQPDQQRKLDDKEKNELDKLINRELLLEKRMVVAEAEKHGTYDEQEISKGKIVIRQLRRDRQEYDWLLGGGGITADDHQKRLVEIDESIREQVEILEDFGYQGDELSSIPTDKQHSPASNQLDTDRSTGSTAVEGGELPPDENLAEEMTAQSNTVSGEKIISDLHSLLKEWIEDFIKEQGKKPSALQLSNIVGAKWRSEKANRVIESVEPDKEDHDYLRIYPYRGSSLGKKRLQNILGRKQLAKLGVKIPPRN